MKKRAISLISGGLDNAVATKLIIEQGIEVIGLHFSSIFASKRDRQRGHMALRTAGNSASRSLRRTRVTTTSRSSKTRAMDTERT